MRRVYLMLAIAGFVAPNILVVVESLETSNYLLYADITRTFNGMFANRISTIFSIDLFFAVLVFFVWSYLDSKERSIKQVWIVWLLTMLFGLAGAFPLYLYKRELSKPIS